MPIHKTEVVFGGHLPVGHQIGANTTRTQLNACVVMPAHVAQSHGPLGCGRLTISAFLCSVLLTFEIGFASVSGGVGDLATIAIVWSCHLGLDLYLQTLDG